MSCYHPLRAVVLGKNPDTNKKIIKILSKSDFSYSEKDYEYITIPCGHCIGCRLKYSRIWADRCLAESLYHTDNIFLTLTYDDSHLPEPFNMITETGVKKSPVSPLVKRDVQLFIKRLRKRFPEQKIRYFACGEYGSQSMRPHYHLLLFGLRLPDLELLYKNDQSFSYFTSEIISSLWYPESDSQLPAADRSCNGYHIITAVTWETCAYVARYIVKKQTGKNADIYEEFNFPPEFTLMSRRPGIGRQYYEDHKFDLYSDSEQCYIPTDKGKRIIRPNKYYDSLYDYEYQDHFEIISYERKELAEKNEAMKQNLTNLQFLDRLSREEIVQEDKMKSLKRSGVL